jgi:hypothetical protein
VEAQSLVGLVVPMKHLATAIDVSVPTYAGLVEEAGCGTSSGERCDCTSCTTPPKRRSTAHG